MFRNGKKVLVDAELQTIHYEFYKSMREDDGGNDNYDDEEVTDNPAYEGLVTWVNNKYTYNYTFSSEANHRRVNHCQPT